ncbi:MAG: hypothetical protein HKL80_03060 [Acidimicrobiales bacterium]|nr:hypothetical protein [Acidimicrobiales bacterium]
MSVATIREDAARTQNYSSQTVYSTPPASIYNNTGPKSKSSKNLPGIAAAAVIIILVFGGFLYQIGMVAFSHSSTTSIPVASPSYTKSTTNGCGGICPDFSSAVFVADGIYGLDGGEYGKSAGAVASELEIQSTTVGFSQNSSVENLSSTIYVTPFYCLSANQQVGQVPENPGLYQSSTDMQCQGLLFASLISNGTQCEMYAVLRVDPKSPVSIYGAEIPSSGKYNATTNISNTSTGCASVSKVSGWTYSQ